MEGLVTRLGGKGIPEKSTALANGDETGDQTGSCAGRR